jgi:hypothetical protein
MITKHPVDIRVEVFNLSEDADKTLYQNILKEDRKENLTIVRDEFSYDRQNNPTITVWYEVYE